MSAQRSDGNFFTNFPEISLKIGINVWLAEISQLNPNGGRWSDIGNSNRFAKKRCDCLCILSHLKVECCVLPTFRFRSFSVASPRLWNALPSTLRQTDASFDYFKRLLKTHLFWPILTAALDDFLTFCTLQILFMNICMYAWLTSALNQIIFTQQVTDHLRTKGLNLSHNWR